MIRTIQTLTLFVTHRIFGLLCVIVLVHGAKQCISVILLILTYYNSVFWISPDNNRILIRGAFVNGDYAGNGVSYVLATGRWLLEQAGSIANKRIMQNMTEGLRSGATMAHDGKTLVALYVS